jgi:phenylalanyl-tRNA synthetase alpha subunit
LQFFLPSPATGSAGRIATILPENRLSQRSAQLLPQCRCTFKSDQRLPCLPCTHTSNLQIRSMENHEPPMKVLSYGRVYRRDEITTRRSPMFHRA